MIAIHPAMATQAGALGSPPIGQRASLGPARLKSYAEVWQKVLDAAQETEVLNLDKRPLILSIFADLAEAVRVSQQTRAPETV